MKEKTKAPQHLSPEEVKLDHHLYSEIFRYITDAAIKADKG
jgi:hypothetical protein